MRCLLMESSAFLMGNHDSMSTTHHSLDQDTQPLLVHLIGVSCKSHMRSDAL